MEKKDNHFMIDDITDEEWAEYSERRKAHEEKRRFEKEAIQENGLLALAAAYQGKARLAIEEWAKTGYAYWLYESDLGGKGMGGALMIPEVFAERGNFGAMLLSLNILNAQKNKDYRFNVMVEKIAGIVMGNPPKNYMRIIDRLMDLTDSKENCISRAIYVCLKNDNLNEASKIGEKYGHLVTLSSRNIVWGELRKSILDNWSYDKPFPRFKRLSDGSKLKRIDHKTKEEMGISDFIGVLPQKEFSSLMRLFPNIRPSTWVAERMVIDGEREVRERGVDILMTKKTFDEFILTESIIDLITEGRVSDVEEVVEMAKEKGYPPFLKGSSNAKLSKKTSLPELALALLGKRCPEKWLESAENKPFGLSHVNVDGDPAEMDVTFERDAIKVQRGEVFPDMKCGELATVLGFEMKRKKTILGNLLKTTSEKYQEMSARKAGMFEKAIATLEDESLRKGIKKGVAPKKRRL